MSEDNEDVQRHDEQAGAENKPRGNPEADQEAVDKGEETLERVKPY